MARSCSNRPAVMPDVLTGQACWFIIQGESMLLTKHNTLPNDIEITSIDPYLLRRFKLGQVNNIEYYCAEIDQNTRITDTFHTLSLRHALSLFNDEQYGLAVKAYSVINWDKNHQFCGRCGSCTVYQVKAFERVCPSCRLVFFPRISPSIIVLIKKADHLLMARSPHFLPGIYGLIAGFVETGESLEETVHREVKEEVGVHIKNLSYFGSQPWPFPDSLMMAFTAEYASGDIVIDGDEIEEAGWYKYDNLPGRPSMGISIASTLINNFVNFCKQK